MAFLKAAIVFSGARPEKPRCEMTRVRPPGVMNCASDRNGRDLAPSPTLYRAGVEELLGDHRPVFLEVEHLATVRSHLDSSNGGRIHDVGETITSFIMEPPALAFFCLFPERLV
jgi:hypothetical protein